MDETPVQRRVGRQIRIRRIKAGLTQQDLAQTLGLARSSVSNIEAGTQSLSLVAFLKIAQELNVSPAALLDAVAEDVDVGTRPSTATLPDKYQTWVEALKRDDALSDTSVKVTS
jgi:transcriptional regulator with XRE-family HTH domain